MAFTFSSIAHASFNEGLKALQNGEKKKAYKIWKGLAEKGDMDSQFKLGLLYYNGDGVDRDYSKSFKWFNKAAKQGYVSAYSMLGNSYFQGQGVKTDVQEAIKWYRAGAEGGDRVAQSNLASMYINSDDYYNAKKWLDRASEQGHAKAKFNLAVFHEQGLATPRNELKALILYKESCKGGYFAACADYYRLEPRHFKHSLY